MPINSYSMTSLDGWIGKQLNFGRSKKDIAKMLNEGGFKSEAGESITTADINRFLSGDENSIIVPEDADLPEPPKPAPTPKEKVAAIVDQFLPLVEEKPEETTPPEVEELEDLAHELEGEEEFMPEPLEEISREELHAENRKILKEELMDQEEARKFKEANLPSLVPAPRDYTHNEHAHPQELARVHAVFSPRAPVELEEDSSFFNIPRLKRKPVEVRTRPYEPKSFGSNVISTRDLSVRKRKPS